MTRTLLVDDAPILRQLVRMVLEADGSFRVVAEAGDGREAIERAREHQPDLVLLDVAMPRMGGLEALPHVRRAAPAARVVVFTGFQDPEVAEKARRAGADAVLHKGLDPHALCRELEAILARPSELPQRPRTRSDRRRGLGRAARLRIPLPVGVVLAVALLLALYGALSGVVAPAADATDYAGSFEDAAFTEPALADADSDVPGTGGAFSVVVPSLDLRWRVGADGSVVMAGDVTWPEARAAFTQWFEDRLGEAPSFAGLRLTTVGGEVLDDRDLLLR